MITKEKPHLEAATKRIISNGLKTLKDTHPDKVWWFMPAMNGFGRAGIPDYVGIINGAPFAVEAKSTTGKLSEAQKKELIAIEKAGGRVFVVHGKATWALAEEWMRAQTK